MLDATLTFEKSRGDDRFSCRPPRRGGAGSLRRQKHRVTAPSAADKPPRRSKLERFLEATTPSVDARYLSKTTVGSWRTCNVEYYPYFELGDLWESFKEPSVYGAGVNMVLDEGDCVVQYYVPYLSGIQLYTEHCGAAAVYSRRNADDNDGYCSRDLSSDGSSDSELETGIKYPKELSRHHPFSACIHRTDGLPMEKYTALSEGFSSDDSEARSTQDHLLFEFFEQDVPCSRVPLADKISTLASQFPELKTLRSCDLLPASWMSVAWYPIYRIPTGPTLKDLDACFLTFHSLSTPLEGFHGSAGPVVTFPDGDDGDPKITLPVFGLATYKFNGSIWTPDLQRQLPNSLQQAANNWLRLLQVHHPDFQFFVSNGAFRR